MRLRLERGAARVRMRRLRFPARLRMPARLRLRRFCALAMLRRLRFVRIPCVCCGFACW